MAVAHPVLRRAFPYFKWTVFGLLGINVVLFFTEQTLVEGLDSLAWLTLLLLFEWETSQLDKPYVSRWEKWSIHAGRILAYGLILQSAVEYGAADYIAEHGAVDLWNALTWIGIVLLLEYDIYFPGEYARWEWYLRNGAKLVLYGALFVFALLWGLEGRWLNTYDALLWILCFFTIEFNVLEFEEEIPYSDAADGDPAPVAASPAAGQASGEV
ncbi:membrane hypothetical protein [Thiocapsa sp. KS1]|nr:hypothetical protein [Thiocapsa sp. KS1]CRI67272.1 membrane hypothetical protein [Thiocapsa sp. KS1]